jgi:hypothetical protein
MAMKRLFALSLILATLSLAACAGSQSTGDTLVDIVKAEKGETLSKPGTCEYPAEAVGKSYTEIPKMKLKGPSRVIFPGAAVTSDHVTNRVNFKVDKKGIIRSVSCG